MKKILSLLAIMPSSFIFCSQPDSDKLVITQHLYSSDSSDDKSSQDDCNQKMPNPTKQIRKGTIACGVSAAYLAIAVAFRSHETVKWTALAGSSLSAFYGIYLVAQGASELVVQAATKATSFFSSWLGGSKQ